MFRELFLENWGIKLVAVALAVLLEWYFYSPDNSIEYTQTAAIELSNIPPSMMVVSLPAGARSHTVDYTVKGPKPLIQQIKLSPAKIVAEIPPNIGESFELEVRDSDLGVPSGVEVVDIEPRKILIRLEPVVSKPLFVTVSKSGEPARGYQVSEEVTPETVNAKGPKGELEGLSIIQTEKIDVTNLRESRQLEVGLMAKGPLTVLDTNRVKVNLKVSVIQSEKTFSKVRVKPIVAQGLGAIVEPAVVEAVIQGPSSELDIMKAAGLELIADGTAFTSGKHEIVVNAKLPEGVTLVKTNPTVVSLTITGR